MRSSFFALSISFILSLPYISTAKDKHENYLSKEKLRGKVISVKEKIYTISDSTRLISTVIKVMNDRGDLHLINTISKEGSLTRQNRSLYDKNLFLIENIDSAVYDSAVNAVLTTSMNMSPSVNFTIYKNDEKGNALEAMTITKGPKVLSKTTMLYDDKNRLVKKNDYNEKSERTSFFTYTYDKRNNNTEYKIYNADSSLKLRFVYTYDKKDRKIESANYDAAGTLKSKFVFKYSDIDKKKNWQTLIRYENDKPRIMVTRDIKYGK